MPVEGGGFAAIRLISARYGCRKAPELTRPVPPYEADDRVSCWIGSRVLATILIHPTPCSPG